MREYEVGVDAKSGFQKHIFNADEHRIVDGALVLRKTVEDGTERAIVVIFAVDKWVYVLDRTTVKS